MDPAYKSFRDYPRYSEFAGYVMECCEAEMAIHNACGLPVEICDCPGAPIRPNAISLDRWLNLIMGGTIVDVRDVLVRAP